MRIFTAIRHASDPKRFYSSLWSQNLYPALTRLNHEIVESQVDLAPASRFMSVGAGFTKQEQQVREKISAQIVAEVKKAHQQQPLDLFLSYFYNAHFDPAAFDEIHQLGIPTVNFYCNSIYQFELVAAIARRVRYSWHAEKHAAPLYRKVGANPVWVQMGAEPTAYYPVAVPERHPSACFVGQRYADRDRWLAALISAGAPVDIYGAGWTNENKPAQPQADPAPTADGYLGRQPVRPGSLAGYANMLKGNVQSDGPVGGALRTVRQMQYRRETAQLMTSLAPHAKGFAPDIRATFSEYEVVLNFSNVWGDGKPGSKLIPHVRLRDFEGPMCRACYVTGFTDEICDFYIPEEEIVTYRSQDEFVDKVRFYLNNPAAAEKIRAAGYKRAAQDHTWDKRYSQLFRAIGLEKQTSAN